MNSATKGTNRVLPVDLLDPARDRPLRQIRLGLCAPSRRAYPTSRKNVNMHRAVAGNVICGVGRRGFNLWKT